MRTKIKSLAAFVVGTETKPALLGLSILLLVLLVWFGATIVRLENQNYAMLLGMCGEFSSENLQSVIERNSCLEEVETRTSPLWHLYYALLDK